MCKQIRLILDKNKDCKSIYSNERKNNAVEKKINQTEFMLLKANCKFEISLNKFFAKHATNYMGKDLLDITLRKYCMRVMLRNEKFISQTKYVDDNGGERQ